MAFFFPPFWKSFSETLSCSCWASTAPQSTVIQGEARNVPFSSPPDSGSSTTGFHIALPFFLAIDGGFWISSEKSIQNAFKFSLPCRDRLDNDSLSSKISYGIALLNYKKFKDQRAVLNVTLYLFPPPPSPPRKLKSLPIYFSFTQLRFFFFFYRIRIIVLLDCFFRQAGSRLVCCCGRLENVNEPAVATAEPSISPG